MRVEKKASKIRLELSLWEPKQMDHGWTIDLLPSRGLDQSILIAVLVGMMIMLFFTETFGWVFIGVVVPGYLASVLVISPTTAVAIAGEAIFSLFVSRLLTYTLGRTGAWTPFFGRDRFFLIVLVSVLVRQFDQTWLLPALGQWLETHHFIRLDLDDDFSSIGLVLVPLTANMFWKLSVPRGLIQVSTVVGLTYLVVRFVLLPYTNLSYSSFELTYENSAIDFVSNAKSYIIMLFTAYLAGVVNLRYGWDFGGILVAALLGLLWLTPTKLALTVFESVMLFWATKGMLRLPVIRTFNVEGSRKVATVFALAFFLKWQVGLAIGDAFPGLKVTDLFAFGYLMSSILAARMLVRKSIRLVLLPALLTSAVGFVGASLIGLVLAEVSGETNISDPNAAQSLLHSSRLLRTPQGVLGYATVRRSEVRPLDYGRAEILGIRRRRAYEAVATFIGSGATEIPDALLGQIFDAELAWKRLEVGDFASASESLRPIYLMHPGERADGSPWEGALAMIRAGATGPAFVVAGAQQQVGLANAAWQECLAVDCAAIILSEPDTSRRNDEREHAPSRDSKAIYRSLRANTGPLWHVVASHEIASGEKRLHLDSSDQEEGAFTRSDLLLGWSIAPEAASIGAIATDRVLRLSTRDLISRLASQVSAQQIETTTASAAQFIGQLDSEFDLRRENMAPESRRTLTHAQYSSTELRLLEFLVAGPLLQELAHPSIRIDRIRAVAAWAQLLGAKITFLPDCDHGNSCFALAMRGDEEDFLLLVRAQSAGLDIEVPRPRRELGVSGFALALWSREHARGLLVHMGHPDADPTYSGETQTVFQALHQALDRQAATSANGDAPLIVQIRGFGQTTEVDEDDLGPASEREKILLELQNTDLIVGIGLPILQNKQIPPPFRPWLGQSGRLGFIERQRLSDGSVAMHGYAAATVPQIRYSRLLGSAQPVSLWLSSGFRAMYQRQATQTWREIRENATLYTGVSTKAKAAETFALDIAELPVLSESHFLLGGTHPLVSKPTTGGQVAASQASQVEIQELLERAQRLAKQRNPQSYYALQAWTKQKPGRFADLVIGRETGLSFRAIQADVDHFCFRALMLLDDAAESSVVVASPFSQIQGPQIPFAEAMVQRIRTTIGRCSE